MSRFEVESYTHIIRMLAIIAGRMVEVSKYWDYELDAISSALEFADLKPEKKRRKNRAKKK